MIAPATAVRSQLEGARRRVVGQLVWLGELVVFVGQVVGPAIGVENRRVEVVVNLFQDRD